MDLFGIPLATLYLSILIISGIAIFLYVLFGDFLEVAGDILNPTLILAFFTIASASGYLFETYTSLTSVLILFISLIISFVISAILHFFVLIPLSSAEESLAYTENSLRGRVGKVITSIPENGFGEVIIENASGRIAKPAAGFKNEAIGEGTNVLIVDIKNGVLYVTMYDDLY